MSAEGFSSRLRVFVSSVQKELGQERAAVPQVIAMDPFLEKHCEAVLFEEEPTTGRPKRMAYLESLKDCAIYLLIVDVEYGRPDGDLSATHHEYRAAQKREMPTAVFIRGLDSARDQDRKPETREFLNEVKKDDHKYKRFHDREDLRPAIRAALLSILKNQFHLSPTQVETAESEHQIDQASAFELAPLDEVAVDVLEGDAVGELVEVALPSEARIYADAGERALASRGLAIRRSGRPSIVNRAGCILFHPQPATRLPQCEILADAYDEPKISGRPKGMETINAPLLPAVRQALAFIDKHTFHPRRVVGLNNVRLDEYPEQALREVLINALAHRDYSDATRKIILRVFSDRIEVASPGYPLKPLTISKLERGTYRPCSRNPLITQTLALMHQMEQRGTGFARMRDAMLNHGLEAPELAQQDGYFVITLRGPAGDFARLKVPADAPVAIPAAVEARLTRRQRQMMTALARGEVLTSKKVQQRFKISAPVAHEDFKRLLDEGLIERVGAGRATRYVPKSSGNR